MCYIAACSCFFLIVDFINYVQTLLGLFQLSPHPQSDDIIV